MASASFFFFIKQKVACVIYTRKSMTFTFKSRRSAKLVKALTRCIMITLKFLLNPNSRIHFTNIYRDRYRLVM